MGNNIISISKQNVQILQIVQMSFIFLIGAPKWEEQGSQHGRLWNTTLIKSQLTHIHPGGETGDSTSCVSIS